MALSFQSSRASLLRRMARSLVCRPGLKISPPYVSSLTSTDSLTVGQG
jgi:hypothetical protein